MRRPIISLITDFGASDHYTGAMKGVMLGICPEAQLIDITHEIPAFTIAEGAFAVSQAWSCFPRGTVHLVVVDPGVGSARRPLMVEASGHRFVAPDNGVLTMVFNAVPDHRVREITATRYFRQPVSRTFHGRDIFAPAAAHLACGVAQARFGKRISDYVRLPFAQPFQTAAGRWRGTILKVDRFGNLVSNFDSETWLSIANRPFRMKIGRREASQIASSYSEMKAGELFVIAGSAGFLEISAREGSAAALAGCKAGAAVDLRLA